VRSWPALPGRLPRCNLSRVAPDDPGGPTRPFPFPRILQPARQILLDEERRQLGELRVLLIRLGAAEDEQRAFARALAQLDELFLLVVVGEFNAGKSALINALLGRRVVEEGVTPTTSRIGLVKYGREDTRSLAGGVYEEIALPLETLLDLSIVDTPGTNAVLREHETLTREFVPRSDLVLFVTSADRPFTESERAFLETIRAWGKRIAVIINKIDFLAQREDVKAVEAFVREKVEALLGFHPDVFPISAREALLAKRSGDDAKLRASGFGELETFLKRTLDEDGRLRLKLLNPLGVGRRVLAQAGQGVHERLAVLREDQALLEGTEGQLQLHREEMSRGLRLRLTDVEKSLQDLERRGDRFLEQTLRYGQVLALTNAERFRTAFEGDVIADLPQAVEKRVEETADWLGAGELRQWQGIAQRVEQRQAVHGTRFGGRMPASLEYDRPGLLKDVRPDVQRILDGYRRRRGAEALARSVRRAALGTLFLPAAGVVLAASAFAFAALARWRMAGLAVAAALVLVGLLLLPLRRRIARASLARQTAELSQSFLPTLTRRFDRELEAGRARVLEGISPYSRFVRSELERLRGQALEIEALRGPLEELMGQIETMG
jgi:small GTP-binding protein